MHYTYLWLREDGTPFYVGKGSGRRAFVRERHRQLPPPEDRILVQEFPDSKSAFDAEIFLISYYGRKDKGTGCLRNLTDGGENPPSPLGRKASPETLAKISANLKGRTLSAEHRAKISAGLKGNERSKGKIRSAETRAKISAGMKGKNKGKIRSAEHRAKISASMKGKGKGKIFSAERRAKISTGLKSRNAKLSAACSLRTHTLET